MHSRDSLIHWSTVTAGIVLLSLLHMSDSLTCHLAPVPLGNDMSHDGLTMTTAFSSLARCQQAGCTKILVQRGTYKTENNSNVIFDGLRELRATAEDVVFDLEGRAWSLLSVDSNSFLLHGVTIRNAYWHNRDAAAGTRANTVNMIGKRSTLRVQRCRFLNFTVNSRYEPGSLVSAVSHVIKNVRVTIVEDCQFRQLHYQFSGADSVVAEGLLLGTSNRLTLLRSSVEQLLLTHGGTLPVPQLTLIGVVANVKHATVADCSFINISVELHRDADRSSLQLQGLSFTNVRLNSRSRVRYEFTIARSRFLDLTVPATLWSQVTGSGYAVVLRTNEYLSKDTDASEAFINPATLNLTSCLFSNPGQEPGRSGNGVWLAQGEGDPGNPFVEKAVIVGGRNRFCNLGNNSNATSYYPALYSGGAGNRNFFKRSAANFTVGGNSTFQCILTASAFWGNLKNGDAASCTGCMELVREDLNDNNLCDSCDCELTPFISSSCRSGVQLSRLMPLPVPSPTSTITPGINIFSLLLPPPPFLLCLFPLLYHGQGNRSLCNLA